MKLKYLLIACTVAVALSAIPPVNSASLGVYRIYLDDDNRQAKFPVKNQSQEPEKCTVDFKNRRYNGKEDGQLVELSNEIEAELTNEVTSRLRYSPKEFILQPKTTQYVAFSLRRKLNDIAAEHRAYLAIKCHPISVDIMPSNGLGAVLELAVPIVIRTGRSKSLEANISISEVSASESGKVFRLTHSGNRSLYGEVYLLDSNDNALRRLRKKSALYQDRKMLDVMVPSDLLSQPGIKIQFQEKGPYKNAKSFTFSIDRVFSR